jgi:hypothetical protein
LEFQSTTGFARSRKCARSCRFATLAGAVDHGIPPAIGSLLEAAVKIRSSFVVPVLCAPIGALGVVPIPLVEPDLNYASAAFLYLAAGMTALVLLIGLIVAAFPGIDVDDRRLVVRSRYGWQTVRQLADGERWVVADGRLWVRRPEGSLEKTRHVARWAVNRRDWELLEQAYPTTPTGAS